jgi:hypothetical protein
MVVSGSLGLEVAGANFSVELRRGGLAEAGIDILGFLPSLPHTISGLNGVSARLYCANLFPARYQSQVAN